MADQDEVKDRADEVGRWFKELDAAKERDESFLKDGKRILELYDGTKATETPFNILYSNTETLHPALYSAIPRPVVQRRFKDEDPLGKAAAQSGQRMLEFLLDTNVDQYDTYDDAMKAAALDALLPGRACTKVKYDGDMDGEEKGSYETVCPEPVYWDRVLHGYAKRWSKVPWVAYMEYIDKPEAERLFGKEMAANLKFTKDNEQADDKKGGSKGKDEQHQGERKTCCIYQIWDKDGGKVVRYVSETYKDDYLKVEDDPLGLTGFFNCPKPLQFLQKTHSMVPTALYVLYEQQAKELNTLTRRITNIAKSIQAKYIYDSELGDDLQKLVDANDNEMVPADKSSSIAAEKGLQNAIWAYPNDVQIVVLRELYATREQCKQVIYEITGISDILRGATKASETLGAQEIKTQWGTLRLKRSQKEVARYARDLCRMMLELAASKFSEETWAKMTGLPFLLSTKYNELTAIAQALTVEVQRIQAQPQPPSPGLQPGQPPQPPPVPPQVQQLQQIQEQLKAPQWSQVLALLKNDLMRAYRIDIETNSTVEPEAAEDQKQIQEVLMAMGQVLQGIGPLVQSGVLPFEAAQVMMKAIIRRYRFGSELEETINAMKPPAPQEDGSAQAAAAAAKAQGEMQQQDLKHQQEMGQKDMEMKGSQAEMDLKMKTMEAEKAILEKEIDLQLREIQLKGEQEKFALQQQAAEQVRTVKANAQSQKIQGEQKVAALHHDKLKTQQATSEKTDSALGKGVEQMQALVEQLAKMVHEQSKQHGETVETLAKAIMAPRKKKAVRGKDGRIESVDETVMA